MKILISFLWPFLKEAIFGRDKTDDVEGKKSFHRKVMDFFSNSSRAMALLILITVVSLALNVIQFQKISTFVLPRENQEHSDSSNYEPMLTDKPEKEPPGVPAKGQRVEHTRKMILDYTASLHHH